MTKLQKFSVYIKPIVLSLVLSMIISIVFYLSYCFYHFGLGKVSVPEWYTGYDAKGLPIPFPQESVIEHWKIEGKTFATQLGGVLLIVFFTLITIKPNFRKPEM
ncbi:hypothetical protein [Bacillus sp. RO1]|uniref:hypothetical protein n=1 Tax=Bacillus sp. RO1 TaxID=2722703 RepID=UPI00145702A8|nr:hypothetical protein [Bacillus sp. RO1]NLP52070.1 hypothetical protein [Bacillus sp. RO1]